jgi:hypothetical protein
MAVVVMAQGDLRKMATHLMETDPIKRSQVSHARTKGAFAAVLGLVSWGWWLSLLYYYLMVVGV